MSKKLLITVGFIAGVTALAGGLYVYFKGQLDKAMNYCYKIKKYRINQLSTEKINLDVDVLFRNRSAFDVDITGYDFNVYLNDAKIAILKSNKKQTVNNNSLSMLTLNVDVIAKNIFKDTKKLGQLILWAVIDKKKIVIKVDGHVSVGSSFIKVKDLPINISMNLDEITKDDPSKEKCSMA